MPEKKGQKKRMKRAPAKKKVQRGVKKNVLYSVGKVIHHGGKTVKHVKKIAGDVSKVLKSLRINV